MRVTTDYLVVGAGASGMAFTDALVAASDADVLVVDRGDRPGGHWVHAYPFVRLHQPSAFYGVASLPLGEDKVDGEGPNAGFYERATKAEILEHFRVAAEVLEATGRVRFLHEHDHLGSEHGVERIRDLRTGVLHEIHVRGRVVDARYLETSVPATHRPSFDAAPDATVVPIGRLPEVAARDASYDVLGSGKTAVDACLWLLERGTDPDRIRWLRPRDAWWHDRAGFQPLDQVVSVMEHIADEAEAAALATDAGDLHVRLEDSGARVRLDPTERTTMYRGGMLSAHEVSELRRITDVVRLGHVRRIEKDRVLLERGEVPVRPGSVQVDCTARGLRDVPPVPVFGPRRIVLQPVRHNSPAFNAALIGHVETRDEDVESKNRLCPPNPYASSIDDVPRMLARTWTTEGRWLADPKLSGWVAASRLNLLRAFPQHQHEPRAQEAVTRYLTHVGPAIERLSAMTSRPA